jgi:hypothetical protein
MNTRRMLASAIGLMLATAGCKDKKATTGGSGAVVKDAGPGGRDSGVDGPALSPGDAPDEETLRRGKRTGLGAPDERAEVATEALIEAMVAGAVPWSRWIDPARGVVELRLPADAGGAVARRCGAGLTAALDNLTATMKAAATGALGYTLDCDNLGLVVADPGGAPPAATCSLESEAGATVIADLVFVPDGGRGLRLIGVSTVPSDADSTAGLEAFEAEMARADARCP